jgi:hypothetical protein
MSKEEKRAILSNPSRRCAPQGERNEKANGTKKRMETKGEGKNRVNPQPRRDMF